MFIVIFLGAARDTEDAAGIMTGISSNRIGDTDTGDNFKIEDLTTIMDQIGSKATSKIADINHTEINLSMMTVSQTLKHLKADTFVFLLCIYV